MSAPKLLTDSILILDGDVLRSDWESLPRFYHARIYLTERRRPARRVQVRVQLEGDPRADAQKVCDADDDSILEAVRDCITEIEMRFSDEWEQGICAELDDQRASEARFYYR